MTKKISVVVQTYNQREFIGDCIDSIAAQSNELIKEIIIIDDCSNDGTYELLLEFQVQNSKIRIIKNEINLGPYFSFRKVHAQATGDYVAHIDGDDLWLPDKLVCQYNYMQENTNIIACGTLASIVGNDGRKIQGTIPECLIEKPSLEDMIKHHPRFILSTLIYRRNTNVWAHFEADPPMDWIFFIALRSCGQISVMPKELTKYRRGVGISSSTNLYDHEVKAINYAISIGMTPDAIKKVALHSVAVNVMKTASILPLSILNIARKVNLPLSLIDIYFEVFKKILRRLKILK